MLIVISNHKSFENETTIINTLFDEGLELFHIRKPNYSEEDIKQLISKIHSKYYSNLVLHQHHSLAKENGINRLHFTETNRIELKEMDMLKLKTSLIHLSTSVHSFKDYENLSMGFDYTFLAPVFDSISKKGYKAVNFKNDLKSKERRFTKLIALGGITKSNLNEPIKWGFDGIAVLGSIWESKNPVKEFIQIKKACNQYEITL